MGVCVCVCVCARRVRVRRRGGVCGANVVRI